MSTFGQFWPSTLTQLYPLFTVRFHSVRTSIFPKAVLFPARPSTFSQNRSLSPSTVHFHHDPKVQFFSYPKVTCVLVYKYPTSICKQLWLYCWNSLKAVPLFSIITTFKHFQLVPNRKFQLLANWQLYNSIISFEWTRFRSSQTKTAAGCRFNNVLFIPEHSCILLSLLVVNDACIGS